MYDDKELLAHYAGTTADWTEAQRAMIIKMGMKRR
jgi:hypothetical protein